MSTKLLTRRQGEVVRAAVKGLSNKQIGQLLNLTEGSVKMMLHLVYQRTGAKNRTELAARYHQEAWDDEGIGKSAGFTHIS